MTDDAIRREGLDDQAEPVLQRTCAIDGCENQTARSIDVWAQDPGAMKATENLEWINIPLCADHLAEHDRDGDKAFSVQHRLKRP